RGLRHPFASINFLKHIKTSFLPLLCALALASVAVRAQAQTVTDYAVPGYTSPGSTGGSNSGGATLTGLTGSAYNIANYNYGYQNAIPASQVFTSSGPATTPSANPY